MLWCDGNSTLYFTNDLTAHATGDTYASQYQRMIQNLADVQGSKPDGSMGASFTKGGIYGFNAPQTGCITVGYNSADTDTYGRPARVNEGIIYFGALNGQDKEKLEATTDIYKENGSLESGYSCHALAIGPNNGTVALTYYKDQAPSYISDTKFSGGGYIPEVLPAIGSWNHSVYGNPIQYIINIYDNQKKNSKDWPGNHLCYPVIICQQVAKWKHHPHSR